jgi:hypothetical protein
VINEMTHTYILIKRYIFDISLKIQFLDRYLFYVLNTFNQKIFANMYVSMNK